MGCFCCAIVLLLFFVSRVENKSKIGVKDLKKYLPTYTEVSRGVYVCVCVCWHTTIPLEISKDGIQNQLETLHFTAIHIFFYVALG